MMSVSVDRLRQHVSHIASAMRPAESAQLEVMREYVSAELSKYGWQVRPHPFDVVLDDETELHGINLLFDHKDHVLGNGPRMIVGAHLDSKPETPGADDNASAVATLLEIGRLLPDCWPSESKLDLELVAFDLEENGMLGGAEHARYCRASNIEVRGMASLEMLGYCDHAANSQEIPQPLQGLYPNTGNFIAVVGNQISDGLIDAFSKGMKSVDQLPVETLAVPNNGEHLQATRLSDHSPFWDAGYPAIMVTDTSFLRNPHYHTPHDTPETLDYEFLSKVAQGAFLTVRNILSEGCA